MQRVYSWLVSALLVGAVSAQVTTSRLEGTITDPQGATVPGAQVRVVNSQTGLNLATAGDDRGYWVFASMPTATYTVTVTHPGFKTANVDNVKLEVGVPATLNIKLELGTLAETVEVRGGVEMLQTATATVNSTLVGRQLHELPFTSRNLTELLVTQAGTAVPGIPRDLSINGLPQSSLNITLDGLNIQDNLNKSSDGYTPIFARADAIEEMTVSSAAAGADSNGEGAAQVRFVTRRGTNDWHGGLFWQHRNTVFNANYYFNSIRGLPRDRLLLNQAGGMVGGPIRKNKLFIFLHYESFRLPQTYTSPAQNHLTPEARQGIFRWRDTSTGAVRSVNLYTLAGAANQALPAGVRPFAITSDPVIAATLARIAQLASTAGSLQSRIDSNNDYNRNSYSFQTPGANNRDFPTLRLDWEVSSRHQAELVYNYPQNFRRPDGLNNNIPILPGTGIVLGSQAIGGQGGNNFSAVLAVRSALSARLTSEIRFGLTGGTVVFNDGVTPLDFAQWGGYGTIYNFVNNPYRVTGQTRRHTPLKQGNANFTWSRSAHLWNFGTSFTQVNTWNSGNNSTAFVPTVSYAAAANDPVNFGNTSLFTTTNFTNSAAGDRTNAAALYSLLTGRVAQVNRSVALDEVSKTYGVFPPVARNRQRQYGLFVQDAWRVRPGFTLNLGVRWDLQRPPENLNGVYTRPGYEGLWGLSGVGNLFRPGTLTGVTPAYYPVEPGTAAFRGFNRLFSPSAGFAWVLPRSGFRPYSWLAGGGQAVLRAGYAISSIREDAGRLNAVWDTNQGRSVSLNVDPNNFPAVFGQAGSVWFRDPSLPARSTPSTPSYPIAVLPGNSVADFDPRLKIGYVQSWNLSLQRELTRDTVLELRYVGNHGTRLWRNLNLNETNIFENGFLDEFRIAMGNLAIARQSNPNSTNFGNQGLAGQRNVPILQTALGTTTDTTLATQIGRAQAGNVANAIATDATRMARLTNSGRPSNFFRLNPTTVGGNANIYVNGGSSTYNALQAEVRRRLTAGLLMQGSYTWSKSLSNVFGEGVGGSYLTLRDAGHDKGPSPWDIRHAFKLNWIYELPFGSTKTWFNSIQSGFLRKAVEGWEIAAVTRIQSGTPELLTGGRGTFNQYDAGVVLYNLTAKDLQEMIAIRKTTSPTNLLGIVNYLPQSLIDNSQAAFEVGGRTVANLDRSKPYVGPPATPGELGYRVFYYGPWYQKWDFGLVKKTLIGERANLEFRAQFLNAFNLVNFQVTGLADTAGIDNAFGQVNAAYRDLTNTNDPGSRMIEFVLRLNF